MSKGLFSSAGTISSMRLPPGFGARGAAAGGALARSSREVSRGSAWQKAIASSSVLHEHVAAAGDGAVHLGAAHLLERHLLADDHLGHARAAEVHAGVALDHHDDVAEGRDVRAAGRARPEEQAHLRHLPAHLHLVVEDAPRAAPPGEHLDLVGDARARRCRPGRASARAARAAVSWMRRIFSTVRLPHEPAFTVESLAMIATRRPSTRRRAR